MKPYEFFIFKVKFTSLQQNHSVNWNCFFKLRMTQVSFNKVKLIDFMLSNRSVNVHCSDLLGDAW